MKKIFRFEDYTSDNGDYVMLCETKEEAKEFCQLMHNNGKRWTRGGLSYLEDNNWGVYKEDTCYNFNYGYFSPRQYYNNEGYTILKWSDFTTEDNIKNQFVYNTKLKDGEILSYNNECVKVENKDGFFYFYDKDNITMLIIEPEKVSAIYRTPFINVDCGGM